MHDQLVLTNGYFAHPSAEIQPGAHVGERTKVWHHAQIHDGAFVGAGCSIGHNCTVFRDAVVGNGSTLEANVDVWPRVTIEDDVFVGPSAVFTNDLTPRAFEKKNGAWVPTRVCRGASIGANATIVCGITIGMFAAIGAGALVTRNVSPYALMVGCPAKRIAWICACNRWTKLLFINDRAACTTCGLRYELRGSTVLQVS